MNLIGVILTYNEEQHIRDCIVSIQPYVDQVIVFDSYSDDDTCVLAENAGARVMQHPFENYGAQRQAALDSLDAKWILFVDADERVTPALGTEMKRVLEKPEAAGYWIPRRNWIVGHEMKAGGFYPDHQLRLLCRAKATYVAEREVHEIVEIDGEEDYLDEPLIHYNYHSWAQFHRKQLFYARYEAQILAGRGIRPRSHNFVLQPLREWRRRFLTLEGWRDGWQGLRLSLLLAWYYGFMPYWILLTESSHSHKE